MRLLSIALLGVFAAGCDEVASIHPLYTDDDVAKPIADARIEGAWISPDMDKAGVDRDAPVKWTITRMPDRPGQYGVEVRSHDDGTEQVHTFNARLVADTRRLFFDAEFRSLQEGEMPPVRPRPPQLAAGHVIGRVWIENDFLQLAVIPSDWFRMHASDGSWISEDSRFFSRLLITSSTVELRRLLLAHADDPEVFKAMFFLCRPGTDCKVRVADAFAQRPNDADALDLAADVFSDRGNHARAIALRRRLTELNPESAEHQLELGDECLSARRFEDARRAFNQAATLKTQSAEKAGEAASVLEEVHRQTAWSYFLEGRYADTLRVVNVHAVSASNASAEPILLAYVALLRLGQPEPAATLLREQANRFVGSGREHALLLRALGRVPELLDGDNYYRMKFFDALQLIAAGDVRRGRGMLGEVLRSDVRPYALAARIELERLDQTG